MSRVLQDDGRFLFITANPDCFEEWTAVYDKVEVDGTKVIGMKASKSGYEVQDTLFLYPLSEIKESLLKENLTVTHIENIRIWTVIEGVKE